MAHAGRLLLVDPQRAQAKPLRLRTPDRKMLASEEQQTELAHDSVEGVIRVGQRLRRSFVPLDSGCQPCGHCQHPKITIKTGDKVRGTHARCSFAREHSGSAGDIQHPMARMDLGRMYHPRCPLLEKRRDEQLFIRFRSIDPGLQCRFIHFIRTCEFLWPKQDGLPVSMTDQRIPASLSKDPLQPVSQSLNVSGGIPSCRRVMIVLP